MTTPTKGSKLEAEAKAAAERNLAANDWVDTPDLRLDGTPRLVPEPDETPEQREVRLDEERIADEMEADDLRGIKPPDY